MRINETGIALSILFVIVTLETTCDYKVSRYIML